MPAAEWSEKTAVEDEQNIFALQRRETDDFAGEIG